MISLMKKSLTNLYKAINALKNMPRQGWVIEGVPRALAEDVAQHSYEVALTSLIISLNLREKGYVVDLEKILAMALLHDFPEAFIGDIIKYAQKYIGKAKEVAEVEALREFINIDYIIDVHKEYIEGKSLESIIVKISDLVATAAQAIRYYNVGYSEVQRILENTKKEALRLVKEMLPDAEEIVMKIFSSL